MVVALGFRLLFLRVGSKRIKTEFFVCDWLWENKKPVFIGLLWGKTSADAVGEPLVRWGALDWVGANTSAKQTAFNYRIGCTLSIAVFKAFNPVCLYFSVVSGDLCPAKYCTTRKSLFLVSKLAITLCLMVVAVNFFLDCF